MAEGPRPGPVPTGPREVQVPPITTLSPPRDPRRASRQNSGTFPPRQVSNTSLTLPTITTSAIERKLSYGEKLVENLTGISTQIAATANLKAEQKRVEKTLGAINYHHEKLKKLDQFPAARDLVSLIRDSKSNEIESLSKELNTHNESQTKLANQAAGLFNDAETRNKKQPSGDLKAIEAEANSVKQSIEKIKNDVAFLKNENTAQTRQNHLLQQQVNEQANELHNFRKSRQEDVTYLRKVCDRGIDQASSEIRELHGKVDNLSNNPIFSHDLKRLEQLESDTSQLKKSLAETASAMVTEKLKEHETPPKPTDEDAVNALTQRLNAIEAALSPKLKNTDQQPTKMDVESPGSKYDHLQKVLQDLIDLQAFKDDEQMKAIEDIDVRVGEKLQETVVKLNSDTKSQIETAMQQAKDDQVLKQLEKMTGLKESSELNDQRLQTLETAITSLESRYNSVNPSSLVDQALPIFQRAYPPPHIINSVIEALNNVQLHLSKFPDLPSLSTTTESHGKQLAAMSTTVTHSTEEMRKRNSEAIAEMRNYKQQIQQDIANFQKGITNLNKLQDSFSSFVRDHHQTHEGIQKTLQDLVQERGRVEGAMSAVRNHVNEIRTQSQQLSAAIDQLKEIQAKAPDLVPHSEQLKELQTGVQDLDHRVSTILDSCKPEDTRLRLLNIEVSLKEQSRILSDQLEGIQDRQKAVDQEISSLPRTSLVQLEQEIETIKNQQKDSGGSTQANGPYQNAMLKMSKDVQKLAKKVRQLEQAKTTIETQLNNAQPSKLNSLENRVVPTAHANQEPLSNKAKKRKRQQSASSTNSPRWA